METTIRFATEEDIDGMLALDKLAYPDEYIVSREKVLTAFSRNRFLYRILLSKNEIIGYHSIVPLTEEVLDRLLDGSLPENEAVLDSQPYNNKSNHIYFNSIVVSPAFRGCGLGYKLLLDLAAFIVDLQSSNYPVTRLGVIPVSKEGLRMSQYFNPRKVKSLGFDGDFEVCSMLSDYVAIFGKENTYDRKSSETFRDLLSGKLN
jgi:GNAT superfamily N-acetyltransferase